MEKKSFITLVAGVVGGLVFALGMCMCLLPEWGMLRQGISFGIAGAVILLGTWMAYRKNAGKQPISFNGKTVLKVLYGFFASLVFGVGMCLALAYEGMMLWGIIIGIVGIVLLLCLIPMCVGWKEKNK